MTANQPEPTDGRRAVLLHGLGAAVRALREAQGLTRQALARRAGLSLRFVAQLEGGEGNISVAKLAEVARALAVTPAALLSASRSSPDGEGGLPGASGDDAEAVALRREIAAALQERTVGELRTFLAALHDRADEPADTAAGSLSIALLGLRGAGKSTVGPLLAGALGRRFLELDEAIQERTGMAVSEIFELHGEAYYRAAERQALEEILAAGEPVVVAVSGGAVTDGAVFQLLRERFLSVWVRATPEQHMTRVAVQGDQRPMADRPNAMAELRALLRARVPFYEQARLVADTSTESPEACVIRLVAHLTQLGAV